MEHNISSAIKQNVHNKISLPMAAALCIVCAFFLGGCRTDTPGEAEEKSSYSDTGFAMGTVINQTIYSENSDIAPNIIELLKETENKWISWRSEDSEIRKINDNSKLNESTVISGETGDYIAEALSIAEKSGGAFDPTIGVLSRLWGFDDAKKNIPPEEDIRNVLQDVDYKKIDIDGNKAILTGGSSIDLGAIGKGLGCDKIERYLDQRKDVSGALINAGGSSIITYGNKDSNEPWKVAVLDPRSDEYLGYIELEGTNHIATSGDYEKYFEQDGKRYHHILDPSTGYPADSGLMSVTVVSKNGAQSDGLSTACFVLGKDKAISLLEECDAEGILVDKNKNVYVTDGLGKIFTLTADGYKRIQS